MSTIVEEQQIVEAPVVDVPTISKEEGRRREVLLRAAGIMEREGYAAGSRGMNTHGPKCLVGAVAHAMGAPTHALGSGARYHYHQAAHLLGVPHNIAYGWSDDQRFQGHCASQTVSSALRRLANGASWKEATSK